MYATETHKADVDVFEKKHENMKIVIEEVPTYCSQVNMPLA